MSNTNIPDLPTDAKAAFAAIQADKPEAAAVLAEYIKGLKTQGNIAVLGTDEALMLRDESGTIRALKQRVRLSAEDGTLVRPLGDKGPYIISAQGYEVLSSASGTCVMCPPEVMVDGQPKANPYVRRDERNGRILDVYARAIAFGYSPNGTPRVSDHTTIFDLPAYRLIDLLGKAKDTPQAFKLLPTGSPAPTDEDGKGKKPVWSKYPFDECTALWIDVSHVGALKWFAQILNREKKAVDFAQTFAKRNAVKHLLGLQKSPGAVWDVPVICWRSESGNLPQLSPVQYAVVQKQSAALASGAPMALPGHEATPQAMDITAGTSHADEPEAMAVVMDEEDHAEATAMEEPTGGSEDTGEVPDPENEEVEDHGEGVKTLTAGELKDFKNLVVAKKEFPDEFVKACKELSLDPEKFNSFPEKSAKILARINAIMDGE